ncbi:MAG: RDD family protein [Patescibacteria group bacterium]
MSLFKSLKLVKNKKYANFLPRFLASLIDSQLLNLPFVLSIFLIVKKDSWEEMLAFSISIIALVVLPVGLLTLIYYPFFLSRQGKTIGKAILGIKLTDKNGKFLSFRQVIFREYICKPVSFLLFGLGMIAILFDKDHQAWHDKLSGTYVHLEAKRVSAGIVTLVLLLATHAYFIFEIFNCCGGDRI